MGGRWEGGKDFSGARSEGQLLVNWCIGSQGNDVVVRFLRNGTGCVDRGGLTKTQ